LRHINAAVVDAAHTASMPLFAKLQVPPADQPQLPVIVPAAWPPAVPKLEREARVLDNDAEAIALAPTLWLNTPGFRHVKPANR
jgi:hypothetical protein